MEYQHKDALCPWGRSQRMCRVGSLASLVVLLLSGGMALAQESASGCGSLENQYGPFDYRTQKSKLDIVERFHFTPRVESLVGGQSTGSIAGDLDYTLRAFPNHHRALMAMVRLGEKVKTPQPIGATYSVECYFERALRFHPDDTTARMIYATYLSKIGRVKDAISQLETVSVSAEDNPFTHYNMGLIYFDLHQYDQALAQAHLAYGLGFTQTALRDELQRVGKWTEPQPAPVNTTSGQGTE